MIRTATTLAILAALSGTASAQEVRVSLIGKAPRTVQAEVHAAAARVCHHAYMAMSVGPEEVSGCIRAAVDDAQAQVKAAATTAPAAVALASTQAGAPRR